MAPTTETKIWMALKARVLQAAGSLPVHLPGDSKFTPPTTADTILPFLAVGDTSTSVRTVISSRGKREHSGIVSLVYVAPLGYPQEWYIEEAAGFLPFFALDMSARYMDVCVRWGNPPAVPRVERGYPDNGYFRTPIIVPWRCNAA